jgi:hypothetical protein
MDDLMKNAIRKFGAEATGAGCLNDDYGEQLIFLGLNLKNTYF